MNVSLRVVCMCVRLLTYLERHQISVFVDRVLARGLRLTALRYIMYFRFCGCDVIFSHNGRHGATYVGNGICL